MKKLKTITLCVGGDPRSVICPGHVTQKTFNDAFKNEGWSGRGDYKQKDLTYVYMSTKKMANFTRYILSLPGKPGAKPYTSTPWD